MPREFITSSFFREKEQTVEGKIEINENFLENLSQFSKKLPASSRDNYQYFINNINNIDIFRDLEYLLNNLTKEENELNKLLESSHRAYTKIPHIGYQLSTYGVEVPWINRQAFLDLKQGKVDEQFNFFRTPEEEQMVKLILKHDALKKVLEYKNAKTTGQKLKLLPEQKQSMEHILQQLKKVQPEWKEELEKLATDQEYYHQSLKNLQIQLEHRLAKQSEQQ